MLNHVFPHWQERYVLLRERYARCGIITQDTQGAWGIDAGLSITGTWLPMPSVEQVGAAVHPLFEQKIQQGFCQWLLIPVGIQLHGMLHGYATQLLHAQQQGVLYRPDGVTLVGHLSEQLPVRLSRHIDGAGTTLSYAPTIGEVLRGDRTWWEFSDTSVVPVDYATQQCAPGWALVLVQSYDPLSAVSKVIGERSTIPTGQPLWWYYQWDEVLHSSQHALYPTYTPYHGERGLDIHTWVAMAMDHYQDEKLLLLDDEEQGARCVCTHVRAGHRPVIVSWSQLFGRVYVTTNWVNRTLPRVGMRSVVPLQCKS